MPAAALWGLALLALALYLPLGTWLFYLACMHVDRQQHAAGVSLHPVAVFIARRILLPVGLVHNGLHNLLTMTLLFLDPPRELATTGRMNRYRAASYPQGWRKRWAFAICRVLLDPFDRRGIHS